VNRRPNRRLDARPTPRRRPAPLPLNTRQRYGLWPAEVAREESRLLCRWAWTVPEVEQVLGAAR